MWHYIAVAQAAVASIHQTHNKMGVYCCPWLPSSFIVPFLQLAVPHKELSPHWKKKKHCTALVLCCLRKYNNANFSVYVHSYSKAAIIEPKLKLQEHHKCQISSFELIEKKTEMFPTSNVIQLTSQHKQSKHSVQSRALAASHSWINE